MTSLGEPGDHAARSPVVLQRARALYLKKMSEGATPFSRCQSAAITLPSCLLISSSGSKNGLHYVGFDKDEAIEAYKRKWGDVPQFELIPTAKC